MKKTLAVKKATKKRVVIVLSIMVALCLGVAFLGLRVRHSRSAFVIVEIKPGSSTRQIGDQLR